MNKVSLKIMDSFQIDLYKQSIYKHMAVLIWIQTVWNSDSVPERLCFKQNKIYLKKAAADDNKSIKIIHHAEN